MRLSVDDKRRRNTAASARFRSRKKAREQALEKRENLLTKEIQQANNRITRLETENKLLQDLLMEKRDSTNVAELRNKLLNIVRTLEDNLKQELEIST